jgi:hypothetical protein
MTHSPSERNKRKRKRLDTLYELREELRIVADSDCSYAKYGQNGLEVLRDAGYSLEE